MTIKKTIGWTLIGAFWSVIIYVNATQIPWQVTLIGLGACALFFAGLALVIWLISDPDTDKGGDAK